MVFTRRDDVWTQQADRLILSANSLALSTDGGTAVMGINGMSFVHTHKRGA